MIPDRRRRPSSINIPSLFHGHLRDLCLPRCLPVNSQVMPTRMVSNVRVLRSSKVTDIKATHTNKHQQHILQYTERRRLHNPSGRPLCLIALASILDDQKALIISVTPEQIKILPPAEQAK